MSRPGLDRRRGAASSRLVRNCRMTAVVERSHASSHSRGGLCRSGYRRGGRQGTRTPCNSAARSSAATTVPLTPTQRSLGAGFRVELATGKLEDRARSRGRAFCGHGVACGRATGRPRTALLGDRGLAGTRRRLVGARGGPRVGDCGRRGRPGALDGGSGPSSLASPIARTALLARRNGRRTSYSAFVANLDESRPGGPCGA